MSREKINSAYYLPQVTKYSNWSGQLFLWWSLSLFQTTMKECSTCLVFLLRRSHKLYSKIGPVITTNSTIMRRSGYHFLSSALASTSHELQDVMGSPRLYTVSSHSSKESKISRGLCGCGFSKSSVKVGKKGSHKSTKRTVFIFTQQPQFPENASPQKSMSVCIVELFWTLWAPDICFQSQRMSLCSGKDNLALEKAPWEYARPTSPIGNLTSQEATMFWI